MFYACYSLKRVNNLDYSKLSTVSSMFAYCYSLRSVGSLNCASATSAYQMFLNCRSLNYTGVINLPAATEASDMFYACGSLWRTSVRFSATVSAATSMFFNCLALEETPDVDYHKIQNLTDMFNGCRSLRQIKATLTAATNLTGMFANCPALEIVEDANLSDYSSVTNASYMFYRCYALRDVELTGFSSLTNCAAMMAECSCLRYAKINSTSNVTSMASMFVSCFALMNFSVNSMAAVTTANSMFHNCYALNEVPALSVSASATDMHMFNNGQFSLRKVGISGVKVSYLQLAYAPIARSELEALFQQMGKGNGGSTYIHIYSNPIGNVYYSKTVNLTAGSTTISMADTSNLATGMECWGTGINSGVACTFQDTGDTVTKAAHGLVNGTRVWFSSITSTTGITTWTEYFVVGAATDTFQVASSAGGAALALTTDGSGTFFYPTYITAITPNTSITIDVPISASGTSVATTYGQLKRSYAYARGWTLNV
jgi:hypothetical protein